jgi:hypothetical protein
LRGVGLGGGGEYRLPRYLVLEKAERG